MQSKSDFTFLLPYSGYIDFISLLITDDNAIIHIKEDQFLFLKFRLGSIKMHSLLSPLKCLEPSSAKHGKHYSDLEIVFHLLTWDVLRSIQCSHRVLY